MADIFAFVAIPTSFLSLHGDIGETGLAAVSNKACVACKLTAAGPNSLVHTYTNIDIVCLI